MFADPPAFVSVKAGATLGTGTQFEFVRVDVGITRPCENTDEAIHAAYEDVSTKVRHYVRVELDAALGVNQQPTSPLANG